MDLLSFHSNATLSMHMKYDRFLYIWKVVSWWEVKYTWIFQEYILCVGCTCSERATPDVYIKINEYRGQLRIRTGKEHAQSHYIHKIQNSILWLRNISHNWHSVAWLFFHLLPDSVVRQLIGNFLQLCPDCGNNFQPRRKILRVACKERGECVSVVRSVVLCLTEGIH